VSRQSQSTAWVVLRMKERRIGDWKCAYKRNAETDTKTTTFTRVQVSVAPFFPPDKRNNPKKKPFLSWRKKQKEQIWIFVVLLLSDGFPTQSLGGQPAVDFKFDYYSPVHSLMCCLSVAVVVVVVVIVRRMTCSVFPFRFFPLPPQKDRMSPNGRRRLLLATPVSGVSDIS
jgi:hypothetical protein